MRSLVSVMTPKLPKEPKDKIYWGNLYGSASSLAIAQAAVKSESMVVVLASDSATANRLTRELKIFLPKESIPVFDFPDWETLPYDTFSPHQDIISDRLLVLSKLPSISQGVLVVPVTTSMHWLSPKSYVQAHTWSLKVGETLTWEKVRHQLIESGYRHVPQVMTHGEFAVRGSIVDIFPMGFSSPVRIDLFDNEIDSLRLFDPESQRSNEKIETFECLPAREFPLTEEAISLFRQKWRALFSGDPSISPIYQDVSMGISPQGIEYYLPLFFKETHTLFDYLPKNSLLIHSHDLIESLDQFWQEIRIRYEQYRHDIERPLLSPEQLFVPTEKLFSHLNTFKQIIIDKKPFEKEKPNKINFDTQPIPDITLDPKKENPLQKLQNFIQGSQGKILFCAESPGRKEALLELLQRIDIKPRNVNYWSEFFGSNQTLGITIADLEEGIWISQTNWIWIAENELYGHQVMQRRLRGKTPVDSEAPIRDLAELTLGAPIVHIDHGIGRYKGLTHITIEGSEAEYLILEYADNDKLYVPVSSLHLISQYSSGQLNHAPLHKLGTEQWDKAKKKALKKAFDVATELLDIYAKRAAKKGHRFSRDDHYFQFATSFPFEETPDQAKTIEQVLNDMESDKPMDRLVCGDVGFGKTEVALRAAFIAAQDSKQVAVLVPTTLLAQQHYETFSDRFADWPIQIEVLSRFKTMKEQGSILEKVKAGNIDIIIGTHKLLGENVQFNKLGLVIIDEEHRFGVRQKEKMKAMRSDVDILTLTATPIPRTLNMAFAQLRDLSIIATPPAKRLSIKTFVREYNLALAIEAILRELMRGGAGLLFT